jgi:hypothetical protein
MEHRWDENDGGKPKYSEKNLLQFHFVNHKSTWTDPGLRGERPATNRLIHGTAFLRVHSARLAHVLAVTLCDVNPSN